MLNSNDMNKEHSKNTEVDDLNKPTMMLEDNSYDSAFRELERVRIQFRKVEQELIKAELKCAEAVRREDPYKAYRSYGSL